MPAEHASLSPVELRLAFHWFCDNCAAENFSVSRRAELTPEAAEKAYREYHDLEDYQELPEDWHDFELVMMPNVVQCQDCGQKYSTQPDDSQFDEMF